MTNSIAPPLLRSYPSSHGWTHSLGAAVSFIFCVCGSERQHGTDNLVYSGFERSQREVSNRSCFSSPQEMFVLISPQGSIRYYEVAATERLLSEQRVLLGKPRGPRSLSILRAPSQSVLFQMSLRSSTFWSSIVYFRFCSSRFSNMPNLLGVPRRMDFVQRFCASDWSVLHQFRE